MPNITPDWLLLHDSDNIFPDWLKLVTGAVVEALRKLKPRFMRKIYRRHMAYAAKPGKRSRGVS